VRKKSGNGLFKFCFLSFKVFNYFGDVSFGVNLKDSGEIPFLASWRRSKIMTVKFFECIADQLAVNIGVNKVHFGRLKRASELFLGIKCSSSKRSVSASVSVPSIWRNVRNNRKQLIKSDEVPGI
jgi:hypothetical protein